MKEHFHVGTYQIGWSWVDLYLNPNDGGGNFCWNVGSGNEGKIARMTIGCDGYSMSDAMEVLAHETIELVCTDLNLRYKPTEAYASMASDVNWFFMDHNQMSEVAARVGNFLWQVMNDMKAGIDLLKE